ncbi:MAG: cysteine synthase A [Myxococcota bacterium]
MSQSAYIPTTGSVWDSVGNTPLILLKSLSDRTGCRIYGKAEFLNPGGSVKDRAAKGILRDAEQRGLLSRGGVVVEGTAGNTGIGLATLAAERGYRVLLAMPDNQTQEKYDLLEALGVEIRMVPAVPFANPNHFYHTAKRLADETPGAYFANQFENPANGDFHFETTGPEIWAQTGGKIDVFTCSVGTSGTMSGISRYLKQQDPSVRVVLVDPHGSGMYEYLRTGAITATGSSVTEGIGIMRLTANFHAARIDDALRQSDQDMIDMLYHLARHDGLVVGTSAALNAMAAYRLALAERGSGKTFVTVLCDHGTRYQSRVLNPAWLKEKGLVPQPLADV